MLSSGPCHAYTNAAPVRSAQRPTILPPRMHSRPISGIYWIHFVVKGPFSNGFYTARAEKKANKLYGLVRCRGDLSAGDCTNCSKNAVAAALSECPKSKEVSVWFTWCFLRYSKERFFGVLEQSAVAIANDTNFDDPYVASKGLTFMASLASTAPNQPHMFQKEVLDVGQSGKRYGMAQCTLDLSRTDCGTCLDAQLASFRTIIGNRRGWETFGSSCFMWYHDYQFYFNVSTPASEGARRTSSNEAIGVTIAMLAFLVVA